MSDRKIPAGDGAPLSGKKVTWGGSALLSPVPAVLVTCADGETVDAVTVAWTGTVCSHPPMTYISLRPERFSYGIIRKTGRFVINLPSRRIVRQLDLCGVKSGRDTDKIAACGFHLQPGEGNVPLLAEAPLSLECRVSQVLELGSHHLFLAQITAVHADEALIDNDGKLRMDKAQLLAYAHGTYYALGKELGTFGFSVRKKKRKPQKKNGKKEKEP